MSNLDYLGTSAPSMVLYLPHRPNGLDRLVRTPDARLLMDGNSNHWRKIVTLLAKVACPDEDWRGFRDEALFQHTALCFAPRLIDGATWHWIGGKENLLRFGLEVSNAEALPDAPDVAIDIENRILLTPYPDYRQLSNATVSQIRTALTAAGFFTADLGATFSSSP
ncbi:hypothetical protein [Microbulbifer sp. YPW1]|uniref:DUF6942 family protein n=1 Tax=Microbulbifer sp. YPW1 TaxID=2745199 RepID=UPI0015979E48|nr:hypothetical protein [Microbulbifer sp. YPW1]QKX18041.1 hypothetical protein HUW35_14305 [Microbulbifer sp. YPW1]